MTPQITQIDADFKLVEFDQFGCEGLTLSNSMGLQSPNRVEFETVVNYGDFATIKGSVWK